MRPFLSFLGSLALLSLALVCPVTPAHAQVVYDNGSYEGAISCANFTNFALADDFTVGSSLTFDAIRFYAVESSANLMDLFSGTLSWAIHTGSGVTPNAIPGGTTVASGSTDLVSVTDTGAIWGGSPIYQIARMEFAIPTVTLPAGTYWLRIKEGLPDSSDDGSWLFWVESGETVTGDSYRMDSNEVSPSAWNVVSGNPNADLSFAMLNSQANAAAPEPGTLALIGAGSGLVGLVARRKR
jgi:hypothetical protein